MVVCTPITTKCKASWSLFPAMMSPICLIAWAKSGMLSNLPLSLSSLAGTGSSYIILVGPWKEVLPLKSPMNCQR
ncbi:hypothetical protein C8Q73DRAFT_234508 [Cubamyces lactineus]|nr:hypothetical protein C8Q73DRAFT_234508 [Cubamyces lactineus]